MIRILLLIFAITVSLGCFSAPQINSLNNQSTKAEKPPILWTADWNPNGKYYAIGGDDRVLRIFNAQDNKLLITYTLTGAIQCLDWNKDGKLLAVAIDDQPVQIYNVETKITFTLKEIKGSRALDWNNDGTLLAVADYDGVLHIFDKKGEHLKSIKKENTKTDLSIHWHPKKNVILTGGDRIRLFDLSGEMLLNVEASKERNRHPDRSLASLGEFFATGDYGHQEEKIESLLQYWTEDGVLMKSLSGSKGEYRNIRWNKEGTLLATASDGLRLWSKEGQVMYSGETRDLLWGIDWDSQNKSIITSSEKGGATLWNAQAKAIKKVL
jgi:WD40 repeat protein